MKNNRVFSFRIRHALKIAYPHHNFLVEQSYDGDRPTIFLLKKKKIFGPFYKKYKICLGKAGIIVNYYENDIILQNEKFKNFVDDVAFEYFSQHARWLNDGALKRVKQRCQNRVQKPKTPKALPTVVSDDFTINGAL